MYAPAIDCLGRRIEELRTLLGKALAEENHTLISFYSTTLGAYEMAQSHLAAQQERLKFRDMER